MSPQDIMDTTLELIEIATPPPSPTAIFDNAIYAHDVVEKVPSPTKRARSNKSLKPSTRKRQKPNIPAVPREVSPPGPPHIETPPDTNATHTQAESFEEADGYIAHTELFEETDGYMAFVTAVEEQRAGFYALSSSLYVVQGWNEGHACVKVSVLVTNVQRPYSLTCEQNNWYHLQRVVAGNDIHIACNCPRGRTMSQATCVHERYIREYYEQRDFLRDVPENSMSQYDLHFTMVFF